MSQNYDIRERLSSDRETRIKFRRHRGTERIRTIAGVRSRRERCTGFPASAREDRDHFRFSSERSETGLSVSRPPRSEGCHPTMGLWPIAPALRSCARITTPVSLFLPRRGWGCFLLVRWPAFFHRVRIASGVPRHSEARGLP